jgi:low affinity Fe/Cu permease
MARKRLQVASARPKPANGVAADCAIATPASGVVGHDASAASRHSGDASHRWSNLFSRVACATAHFAGQPVAFLTAAGLVVFWAVTGPFFHYSDTWQLVINTSTTIVTFLMVFLIQHTQNRDTLSLQLKLSELIISMQGAENRLAAVEDLSEEELEHLHADYRRRAEEALDHLEGRRTRAKRVN